MNDLRYAIARGLYRGVLRFGLVALTLLPKNHPARICATGRIKQNYVVVLPAMIPPRS